MDCRVCSEYCHLEEGMVGPCGVREMRAGKVRPLSFGGISKVWVAEIERAGFYHVLPGSRTLCASVAEGGPRIEPTATSVADFCAAVPLSPTRFPVCFARSLADRVQLSQCGSALFTLTEPSYFPETILAAMGPLRARGLAGLIQTNGSLSSETVASIANSIDGASVLVPTLTERTSRRARAVAPHRLRETVRDLWERGVWVEVTTVLVDDVNDSRAELAEIALSLADIHPSIPWHLRSQNDEDLAAGGRRDAALRRALEQGDAAGLRNLYTRDGSSRCRELTFCHECGDSVLIERVNGHVMSNYLRDEDLCPRCGTRAHGLFRARRLQITVA